MIVLVLNMGMKSIRSIILDEKGVKYATSAKTLTSEINVTRVEQNPEEWWEKAIEVMKDSIQNAKIKKVDYITVTTSASCLVCLGQDGNSLGNAIMVSDKRAVHEVEEIKQCKSYVDIKTNTNLDVSVSLMLPKILWIKHNEPDIFNQTVYFLSPNDFLVYRLCKKVVTDELNAIKYHYSLITNSYPRILLDELGIPFDKLPSVTQTGQEAGSISHDVAKRIGCSEDTKIVITSYDAICSFVGSGASAEGEASDVSGTVTVFRMLTQKSELIPSKYVYTTPFYQGHYKIVGGSNNLGGGLIEWVKQCYYAKEEYPYEVMEKEASESDVGARGIIFLPYLLGERAPIWNDNARGVFFGLERMHTRKDMTRAVFEAAAFIDRSIMEAIGETSASVTSLRLSGGLARMNLISQIKADVTGKKVFVLSDFETTANGAAMMVLNGQKGLSFSDLANHFSKIRTIVYPDAEKTRKYNVIYELFKETYQQLLPLFERRIELLKQISLSKETQLENL